MKYHRFLYLAGFQGGLFGLFLVFTCLVYGLNWLTVMVLLLLIVGTVANVIFYYYFKKIHLNSSGEPHKG
ncbi:hypothetical protein [Amphibacillus sediminis]|uniref:hypothetical protein n=1 Tax=Amphibacillus sediminis TaxID=360185 RepID=UPI0008324232|nr:hypothetical protein [Amphibacillus sediminis]